MCLITFNWQGHHRYRLILVASRDEFFGRPTERLHQWESGIYAGKDLKGGGAWMGAHPVGKFAALTNFRDFRNVKENPISRGKLVTGFLEGRQSPEEYLADVEKYKDQYDGFNLLVAEQDDFYYYSNYAERARKIPIGIHGLSNGLLDEPWKKVVDAKSRMKAFLEKDELSLETLVGLHLSTEEDKLGNLPDTGIEPAVEQSLSAAFIRDIQGYGTVSVTAMLWSYDGEVNVLEKQVRRNGVFAGEEMVSFTME
ncbi:NRDE family protein [Echinicola soli]|uniref:NRDE family protein n=1 Tax=Echinicola soli TaxID=2591634 RepID=A0A514CHG9_9BACT|nr:NRDE family protein [Echinicola soli]QDH79265.1 NRDE family protein [Echinicola soli]